MNNRSKYKYLALIWLFVVALVLSYSVYLWLDKHIKLNTDILALLPADQRDPVLQQALTHMVDAAQQRVVVLLGATNWSDAVHAADAYTAVINRRPDLLEYISKQPEQLQSDLLNAFAKSRANLLTTDQQTALRTQPAEYWIDTALRNLYSPFASLKFGAWQDDPFGLFGGWLQARAQETPVRMRDGKLFVADNNHFYVVLIMNMRASAFAMQSQAEVISLLQRADTAAKQKIPAIEIISTGVVLHAAAASQQAQHEMAVIGFGSLLGILLLIWMTFRSFKPLLLIGLSIGVGCLGAFAVSWFIFDSIHLLTLVFGASLIGVAQDYGIYFLCNRLGANQQITSTQLLRYLWPGLCLTLAAAVLGYMGLALTPFPELRQMAVFSGLGLIFAWLTVVCWFPLLVQAQDLRATHIAKWYAAGLVHWPRLQMNRKTLVITGLFLVVIIVGLLRLTVNDDIRSLQKSPQVLIDNQMKFNKLLDVPTPVQFYLVHGATTNDVLLREEILKQHLAPLIAQHVISGYQAVSNWTPSLQMQANNKLLVTAKLLTIPLQNLAQKIDEDNVWAQSTKNRILSASILLTPGDFLKTTAGEPLRYLWLGKVENEYASIVALRGLNSYANLPLLQHAADKINGVQWVDKIGQISSLLQHYRQYMSLVVMCAYVVIYALLFLRYRLNAWRVLMPPLLASIITLAFFGIFGIPLQLFHVLALMLILGLGVDYGIFLQEATNTKEEFAWLTIGLSAVSALLSFGLLSLSKTPPLHAFGLTMLIGMTIVWFTAPCFRKSINFCDTINDD